MLFKACRAFNESGTVDTRIVDLAIDDLSPGEVVVKVAYSSINYKDALAATGRGKIMRKMPLNVGIDLAGTIELSTDPRYSAGQAVLLNGCGLGESHDGGMAEFARVKSDWIIPMPEGFDAQKAMALGTAGFTAALCVQRMQDNGQNPSQGPIAVTGATGGVGSIAVMLLSSLGFEVVAVTSRKHGFESYLKQLGAHQVMTEEELNLGKGALEKARFGGAIDNVGGDLLANLAAHTTLWGNIACVGMAASMKLHTTVFPLILRGVSLLGVSSANCPMPLRKALWHKLAVDYPLSQLDSVTYQVVALNDVLPCFEAVLDRKIHGRFVVKCGA